MTAHVAERGEGRGRVVLRLNCTAPINEAAVGAALLVARAFGASVECLLLEDRQVFDAAAFGFTRECPLDEAGQRPIAIDEVSRRLALAVSAAGRRVIDVAASADVPVELHRVLDSPVNALVTACQSAGPWNVVALGEIASATMAARMDALFERVTGMTGVIIAGTMGERLRPGSGKGMGMGSRAGPVVAVVEHADRLTGMMRTASRIAAVDGRDVVVALTAESRSELAWLDTEVRAAIAGHGEPRTTVVLLPQPGGGLPVLVEELRRLSPAFVIAAFGGLAAPAGRELALLTAMLPCPVLLAR
ncbi:MAG: hypothetical protein ACK4MF_06400 [Hyphomicrobiaceae bacterium]